MKTVSVLIAAWFCIFSVYKKIYGEIIVIAVNIYGIAYFSKLTTHYK